jgi:hypothetical protein
MSAVWPKDILQALERAMSKMPAAIRNMALSRLKEDVETRLSAVKRDTVTKDDVLLVARRMISGRMYEGLTKELGGPTTEK